MANSTNLSAQHRFVYKESGQFAGWPANGGIWHWGDEIRLRDDGRNWDFGYTRTIQRTDGKLVTLYYYTTAENPEQHIAATIWSVDEA